MVRMMWQAARPTPRHHGVVTERHPERGELGVLYRNASLFVLPSMPSMPSFFHKRRHGLGRKSDKNS